jgi:hypothetical protein
LLVPVQVPEENSVGRMCTILNRQKAVFGLPRGSSEAHVMSLPPYTPTLTCCY